MDKPSGSSGQESELIKMQARFFVLMAVSDKPSYSMNDKIERTAMASMLNLWDVFELVDERLNDDPFAQQELVRKVYQAVFHVFTETSDEVKSVFKQELHQESGDVATISKELASQIFYHLRNRRSIINIAWSETARQQLTAIIDSKMQLEAIKPSHAALALLGIGGKDPMVMKRYLPNIPAFLLIMKK